MICVIPDSALNEVNHCHGTGSKGHPCDGDSTPTVDTRGVTHVGDYVELYHGTSASRASKITKGGFKIRAVKHQTMGGDPESSRNYIWFAKQKASAQQYAAMHRHPVVVTVRVPEEWLKKLDPYGRNTGPVSVWVNREVPAKFIHTVEKVSE